MKFICKIALLLLVLSTGSCKKYLDTKSVQTLTTPETLDDLQAILDNPVLTTGLNLNNTMTDEYYLRYTDWNSRSSILKQGYTWDAAVDDLSDWNISYKNIFYANTVLDYLPQVKQEAGEKASNIKGMALFIRAFNYFNIASIFALQYDPATAATENGIVLRANSDFDKKSVRSSLEVSWQQILADAEAAIPLLPATAVNKNRPSKAAGYALLAKIYLQTGNYQKAYEGANSSLNGNNALIDYNQLNAGAAFPLGDFQSNKEILYYTRSTTPANMDMARARIDTILYRSFVPEDKRKTVFFKLNSDGSAAFKGNYTGTTALFNGIAIDEVYLIRAETQARLGKTNEAMNDLNALLQKRWVTNTFVPLTASSPDEALTKILVERKKELINRGTRWPDLKRLNKNPATAITLKRDLNGTIYTLPPNDLRYALLVPQDVILKTNITQNKR